MIYSFLSLNEIPMRRSERIQTKMKKKNSIVEKTITCGDIFCDVRKDQTDNPNFIVTSEHISEKVTSYDMTDTIVYDDNDIVISETIEKNRISCSDTDIEEAAQILLSMRMTY